MQCEICKKNAANLFVQVYSNGKTETKAICMACAAKLHGDFLQAFTGFTGGRVQEKSEDKTTVHEKFCSACGRQVDAVDDTTVFECAECYRAADDELMKLYMHPEDEKTAESHAEGTRVEILAHKIREALVSEDYESAAGLRDQMKELRESAGTAHE